MPNYAVIWFIMGLHLIGINERDIYDLSDIGVCSDSDQDYSEASSDDDYPGAVSIRASIICGGTHNTPGNTSPLKIVSPFSPPHPLPRTMKLKIMVFFIILHKLLNLCHIGYTHVINRYLLTPC